MVDKFSSKDFIKLCNLLATQDPDLRYIIETYGYPQFAVRPNSFETLVRVIIGQQVSVPVADMVLDKLLKRVKKITPQNIMSLSDQDFKLASFSRQKMAYLRDLSQHLMDGSLNLQQLETLPNDDVRQQLIRVKGIGSWTANIYLIFVLQRSDVFPVSDLAIANGLKELKQLPKDSSQIELLRIANTWQPYRSIAALLLWHFYRQSK